MHRRTNTQFSHNAARLAVATLATTALVVGGIGSPVHAATTVTRNQLSHEAAIATFVVIEECKRTRVEIFSNASTELGSRTADEIGIVAVSILNTCTNLSTVEGFGQTSDIDLRVDSSLAKAELKISLPLSNILDGTSTPLIMNLHLAATGAPTTTVGRDTFVSDDGTVFTAMALTTTRQAKASGTVVLGSEEIVGAGDVSTSASINKAKTFESIRER